MSDGQATRNRQASKYSGWGNVRYVLRALEGHLTTTVPATPRDCERMARYLRTALRIEGELPE